jgi:hypothetical protein
LALLASGTKVRAVRIGSFGALLLVGAALSSMGCAASPALRAAEAHDLAALAREIAAAGKLGHIDDGEARSIARAVAVHEIENAKGDDGAKALEAFSRCARTLDGALEARAKGTDDLAAAAARTRLEEGRLSPDDARELALRPGLGPVWRTIETRALIRAGDGPARRARLLDGDQEIRVAALRASADAGDAADTDPLLEAARLDPFPLARTLAVRAVARTATGERAVLALRDLWTQADEDLRQSIADAWATERNIDAGGRRELWWAAEHAHGAAAIAAAGALSRWKGEGWNEAIGVLTRAIQEGPTADRVFAIGIAPAHEPPIDEALRAAVNDKDDAVAVTAAWRQLSGIGRDIPEAKDRKAIVDRLLDLAKSPTTRGFQAQKALARAGERGVLPFLDKQVALADTRARETTGVAFVDLREPAKAVGFVADADVGVRAAVACALLEAPKN